MIAKKISPGRHETGIGEYRWGIRIMIMLLIAGIFLEWITGGKGVTIPSYPENAIIGSSFIALIVILHIFFRNSTPLKILSGIPVSLCSMIFFFAIILLMGLINQTGIRPSSLLRLTGLNHISRSYLFVLSSLYLLITLGFGILRRLFPLNLKSTGMILVHSGLWVVIYVAGIGSGDARKLGMLIYENETVWFGFAPDYKPVVLPFMFKLLDYRKEEYPAKIVIINRKDPAFSRHFRDFLFEIEPGREIRFKDWSLKVIRYIPQAKKDSSQFRASSDSLTTQAVFIHAGNEKQDIAKEGWISCKDHLGPGDLLILDSAYSIGMTVPEAKTYTSKVELRLGDHVTDTALISVNKPLKASGGYRLYQSLYEDNRGKYSNRTLIEAVRDPWQPFIFTGMIMVMAGLLILVLNRLISEN